AADEFSALSRQKRATCSSAVCYNGGTCNNFTDSPPCLCPLPYIAPYCRVAADYCFTLQPDKGITELPVCLNDGNCTLTYADPYFNCSCLPGFYGLRCEHAVVPEASTLPSDGGTSPNFSTETKSTEVVSTGVANLTTSGWHETMGVVLLISVSVGVPIAVVIIAAMAAAIVFAARYRNRQKTSRSGDRTRYVWEEGCESDFNSHAI
uniref:EGF-like domain-containing protein n=1 Tax=Macrostomum lignano TaxID=282301 RepID=A0A1I8G8U7_9PLAT